MKVSCEHSIVSAFRCTVFPITICNILAFSYELEASSKVFIVRDRGKLFWATSEPRAFYLFEFKN